VQIKKRKEDKMATTEKKEAKAILRTIRVSPRKLNLLAQMVRGLPIMRAVDALTFSQKRSAVDVRKTLMSAVANAENNHGCDVDRLYVKEAYVGRAIVLKRFEARAKGRGNRIVKPFSHLTVIVSEREV
jgi:large subunit ribosomal protein L22